MGHCSKISIQRTRAGRGSLELAVMFLNTGVMQDEVAKRHCFACIFYIAKGIIEGSRGQDAQQKRATASLSEVLRAFDVGYGFPDCPC